MKKEKQTTTKPSKTSYTVEIASVSNRTFKELLKEILLMQASANRL